MKIAFTKFDDQAKMPIYGSVGAAGADLCAVCPPEGITIFPAQRVLVHTGIGIQLPEGYAGLIFARSSMGVKQGICLSNGVGVVDWDYRGEILVGLINLSDKEYTILPGERIAQLVVTPVARPEFVQVDSLDQTQRGTGGFGSTGRVELQSK